MTLYKNINGVRIQLTEAEEKEFFENQNKVDLDKLKGEKIQQLKNNCQNYIYSVYPIYKQLDIINPLNDYSIEKKEEMNAFIDENRNICKEKEELIKQAKSNEELKKINIDFNKE